MGTKKQYFNAVLKNQNYTWQSMYKEASKNFLLAINCINAKRSARSMALAYTRVFCYITSSDVTEFDGLIDNIQPSDIRYMVSEYFMYKKLYCVKQSHEDKIAYKIYVDLFPDSNMGFNDFLD